MYFYSGRPFLPNVKLKQMWTSKDMGEVDLSR